MRPGRGPGTSRQYHRPGEGAARQLLLSPGRRRRSAASPEARPVPAGARDRDARARARRPAVDPSRRGAARADPGLGAPGALPRPDRPQAGRGAPRQGGPRAPRHPDAAARPPRARPRRERVVEPHRDPGRDPARPQARDRRRDHDLAAELDPPRRRRGEARDRRPLGRRPARLRRRPRAPALGEQRPCGRRRRSIVGVAKLVARSADAIVCVSDFIADEVRALEPRGRVAHDRERLRLRRLRRARRTRPARGCGSRTPAASSASATRARSCRRCTTRSSTSSPASSATSAAPTASGRRGSASATGSS